MNGIGPSPPSPLTPLPQGGKLAAEWPEETIFTIGHSTRSISELVGLLEQVGVDLLVDVRSIPRSRTNPQFNFDSLPEALAGHGIGYRHIAALGGLKSRSKSAGPSPNDLWRNGSFRNYADYAMTEQFRDGLADLRAAAPGHRAAIMCAEAVWWRCHRRIIADYLLARGIPVRHILGMNHIDPATLTPAAQSTAGGTLVYPERAASP
ncbi:MAG: DUF488 family protein [Acetobacteraceae bacterium]